MAKRIFELARELGVTSKLVLVKCRAEGLDIKNHMSTVSAGLGETICEWFSDEQAGSSAVETTEHVDLKKAQAEAKKVRRRRKKVEPPAEEPLPAKTPGTPVAEAPSATAADAAAAEAPAPVAEPVAEAPEAPGEPAAEPVAEAAPEPAAEKPAAEKPEPPGDETPADKPKEKAKKKPEKPPEPIRPAGPQVVPQPAVMKGPRVVRVEKPDVVDRPRRRIPSPRSQVPAIPVPSPKRAGFGPEDYEERRGKDAARRSPRRRGSTGRRGSGTGPQGAGGRKREIRDQDMQERTARLAAAVGGGMRRHRASVGKKAVRSPAEAKIGKVEVQEPLTVKNISAATGIKSTQIIRKLMEMGVLATVNQIIDREVAETVLLDFDIELVVRRAKSAEEELIEALESREKGKTSSRAPVVAFLGHVDHGKTSLLDYIRKTSIADGEAGGITQHIGAYRYDMDDKRVVFLDTPGHEAFTAMRARGANITDVVVLVVAADDGVMPQTVEAINHAKAADVPVVVALNKIDVPGANPTRALGQLAENGLNPREWGGEVEVIQTDAITGTGIDALVETLSLEAELLELRAEVDAPASGYVVEAEMDRSLGAVAIGLQQVPHPLEGVKELRLLLKDGNLLEDGFEVLDNRFGRIGPRVRGSRRCVGGRAVGFRSRFGAGLGSGGGRFGWQFGRLGGFRSGRRTVARAVLTAHGKQSPQCHDRKLPGSGIHHSPCPYHGCRELGSCRLGLRHVGVVVARSWAERS